MDVNGSDIIEWQTGINKAFGRMYFAIYSVDVLKGQYLEISTLDIFREHIPPMGDNSLLFNMVVRYYVSEGYKEGMTDFLNMDTLQERLSRQNAVSNEFFGTTQGWCRASLVVEKRDEKGCVTRFAYVTQEINEEIKTEQERITELKKAYEEVEMANQSKSEFLFQMSHDIRTPLNAIMGFGTLIEACADKQDKVREYASKIRSSGNFLLSLINEILDMTKAECGKTVLNVERFSMSELISELEIVIRSQTTQKNQSFSVEYERVSHDRFVGDKVRISRVLFNILGNAVKYTGDGGSITFSITEEEADGGDSAILKFCVRDNGIGMSSELQNRIFDEFSRGSDDVSDIPGIGLGLPIAKSFTEMMGGSITVLSEEGSGSEFTVIVPLTVDKMLEKRRGSIQDDGNILSGLKVLIVEDNILNMEIITEILEMAGVRCDMAYSGQEAIDKVAASREGAYDLIVMDVCMPKMDGYETTGRIRSMDRQDMKKIPIVALTANAFEEDMENSKKAGMNAHLAKPLNMPLFKRTVKELLNL